jgi:hypothetical protein
LLFRYKSGGNNKNKNHEDLQKVIASLFLISRFCCI